jgi:hypothetical protein
MTDEEKRDAFMWKLVWFHHNKHVPGNPNAAINELTKTIKQADESSQKLTQAIKNITLAGVIISGIAILLTGMGLMMRYYGM